MPELPEVETIRRGLKDYVLGKRIVSVQVLCEKSFLGPTDVVENTTVLDIRRFGKAMVFDLDNVVSFIVHLRMTGQMIYRGNDYVAPDELSEVSDKKTVGESFAGGHPSDSFFSELPNKQTRVIFQFEDGTLYFNDQRKFGFVKPMPTEEIVEDSFIKSLAPEPWNMSGEELYQRLQRHKNSPVKAVILDQKVICGLGNIYADEALFYAGIYPGRRAGEISRSEAELLIEGARKVMEDSINSGGSTMATYVRADGTKGDYLELFAKVFRREGKECLRCGSEILKTRVAGRGTHYCPKCQEVSR
jgi:formamidopyrimidine-DNA glycosylase